MDTSVLVLIDIYKSTNFRNVGVLLSAIDHVI